MEKTGQIKIAIVSLLLLPLVTATWVTVINNPGVSSWTSGNSLNSLICAVNSSSGPVYDESGNLLGVSEPTTINGQPAACYLNDGNYYLDFNGDLQMIYTEPIHAQSSAQSQASPSQTGGSNFYISSSSNNPVDIQSVSYGLYTHGATADYSIYFRDNSNTGSPIRFEKDGYYFVYDISSGAIDWVAQPGHPAATTTLGGGHSSNTLDTTISVAGSIAEYANAYSDLVDAYYNVSEGMVKETYVLRSLPSIKDYTYLELTGHVEFNKSLDICANDICYVPHETEDNFNTTGQIDFRDADNNTVFYLRQPIIRDSTGHSTVGLYVVHGSNAQMQFDLRIPTSFLSTAVFPVYIDPTIVSQNESKVVYTDGNLTINATLMKKIGNSFTIAPDTIFINASNPDFLKFGAIDTANSGIEQYRYVVQSNQPLHQRGYDVYYIVAQHDPLDYLSPQRPWNETFRIGFDDVCSKKEICRNVRVCTENTTNRFNRTVCDAWATVNRCSGYDADCVFTPTPTGYNVTFYSDANIDPDLSGLNNNCTALKDAIEANCSDDYNLLDDLDCTGQDIQSICSAGYTGTFDGQNHTITGFIINQSGMDNVGLFAQTNGTIKNIRLLNISVLGNNTVGGLIGYAYNVNVDNCYAIGNISGGSSAGGLIGGAQHLYINDTHFTGSVTGSTYVGGLVGFIYNYADIDNSYTTGNVSGINHTGGLVGDVGRTNITNSYSLCNVIGDDVAGGLAGYITYYTSINNSYAASNVSGNTEIGGLVGHMEYNSIVDNCYATGNVHATGGNVGGLVGFMGSSTVNNSYSNTTVSGTTTRIGGLIGYGYKTTVDNSYSIASISSNRSVGGLIGATYYANVTNSHSLGDVTCASYQCGGLIGYGGYANIDNSYTTGNIIGVGKTAGLSGQSGHATINNSNATGNVDCMGNNSCGGLLGWVEYMTIDNCYSNGTISNITSSGGGIVGYVSASNIINSYSTSNVLGSTRLGGLAGYLEMYVIANHTHATGNITGTGNEIGGLVGYSTIYVTLDNSYATGDIIGANDTGGLVGYIEGSTVNNSNATGDVNASGKRAGGLVGYALSASIIDNSYAISSVSAAGEAGGLVGHLELSGIRNSHSESTVNATGNSSGGLVGYSSGASINDSYSACTGVISGDTFVGGLIGEAWSTSVNNTYATCVVSGVNTTGGLLGWFEDCFANYSHSVGNVSASLSRGGGFVGYTWNSFIDNSYAESNVTGGTKTGGFAADFQSSGSVNISATGDVSGTGFVGGLIGYSITYSTVDNGYATGTINGTNGTGGLIGYGERMTIRNSSSSGLVYGENSTGGLIGVAFGGTIDGSYSDSDVTCTGEACGGLIGNLTTYDSLAIDSYATGNVTGGNYVSGFIGFSDHTVVINNSYAAGNISCTSNCGGLAGGVVWNSNVTVTNSFYSGIMSGCGSNCTGIAAVSGAVLMNNTLWLSQDNITDCYYKGGYGHVNCTSTANVNDFYNVENQPIDYQLRWQFPPWNDTCNTTGYPPLDWQNLTGYVCVTGVNGTAAGNVTYNWQNFLNMTNNYSIMQPINSSLVYNSTDIDGNGTREWIYSNCSGRIYYNDSSAFVVVDNVSNATCPSFCTEGCGGIIMTASQIQDMPLYLPLDNSETNVIDYSGGGNNFTLSGNPVQGSAGKVDKSIYFDGTGDYATDVSPAWAPTGDQSGSFWLNIHSFIDRGSVTQDMTIYESLGSTRYGTLIRIDAETQQFYIALRDDVGLDNPNVAAILQSGTWYQIVYTYDWDTENLTLYINGTQNTSDVGTSVDNPVDAGTTARIGDGITNPNRNFDGYIDDFRIYNRTLTSTEALELYQLSANMSPLPAPPAPSTANFTLLSPANDLNISSPSNFTFNATNATGMTARLYLSNATNNGCYPMFWEGSPDGASDGQIIYNPDDDKLYGFFGDMINDEIWVRASNVTLYPDLDAVDWYDYHVTISDGDNPVFAVEYANSTYTLAMGTHNGDNISIYTATNLSNNASWTLQCGNITYPGGYDQLNRMEILHNSVGYHLWVLARWNDGGTLKRQTLYYNSTTGYCNVSYQGVAVPNTINANLSRLAALRGVWYSGGVYHGLLGGSPTLQGTWTYIYVANSTDAINWTIEYLAAQTSDVSNATCGYEHAHFYPPRGAWVNNTYVAAATMAESYNGAALDDNYDHDQTLVIIKDWTNITPQDWYSNIDWNYYANITIAANGTQNITYNFSDFSLPESLSWYIKVFNGASLEWTSATRVAFVGYSVSSGSANCWDSVADPHPLCTCADLQRMGNNTTTVTWDYSVSNDINCSNTTTWNGGLGFAPVADAVNRYTGTFNGNNHAITGLFINRPNVSNIGVFSYVNSAHFGNVSIEGNITGNDSIGFLFGYDDASSTVDNVNTSGYVQGNRYYAGGVIGVGQHTIVNHSSSSAAVNCTGACGGLIGSGNYVTVDNAYTTGNVSGGDSTGGLIGQCFTVTLVDHSYATGNVVGTTNTGGLLGSEQVSIILNNSYFSGSVTSTGPAGGLIGTGPVTIDRSNFTGTLTGEGFLGGIVGKPTAGSHIYNTISTGNVTASLYYAGGILGLGYTTTLDNSYSTGTISALIGSGGLMGGLLTGNITNSNSSSTVNGTSYVGGIMGYANDTIINNSLVTGVINGGNWTGGLIGLDTYVTIIASNSSADVTGWKWVGGLVGYQNDSTINHSHFDGTLDSDWDYDVGGLVGYQNRVSIDNSYADFDYTTGVIVGDGVGFGGLVGNQYHSNITNSHFTGDITALDPTTSFGGLVGYQAYTVIDNCYAIGNLNSVNTTSAYGGLVGYQATGSINNSYFIGNLTSVNGSYYFGGLVGTQSTASSISNSNFTGTMQCESSCSGFAGIVGQQDYSTVDNVYSTFNISLGNASNYMAGIVGTGSSFNVSNAHFVGNIVGGNFSNYYGGIAGNQDTAILINCTAVGTLFGGNHSTEFGGIVGYQGTSSSTSNANFTGTITLENGSTYAGGIAGIQQYSTIDNSYATANIAGGNYTSYFGGIVGHDSYYTSIDSSQFSGNIQGGNYSHGYGGIAGFLGISSNITDSLFIGTSTGTLSADVSVYLITADDGSGAITNTYGTIYNSDGNITFLDWNVSSIKCINETYSGCAHDQATCEGGCSGTWNATRGGNLTGNLAISANYAFLNSTAKPYMNKPANITFLNMPQDFTSPVILRNGVLCDMFTNPSCYNLTSLNAATVIFNVSAWSNYTIRSNHGPSIDNITASAASYNPVSCNTTPFSFELNYTDDDGWDDIQSIECNATNGTLMVNTNCTFVSNSSNVSASYDCNGTMQYYYLGGAWSASCRINDSAGASDLLALEVFNYTSLDSITATGSISWGTLLASSTDVGADDDPIVITNCGNNPYDAVNVTGYDLVNVSSGQRLYAEDFSVNVADAANGDVLTNATTIAITGATLPLNSTEDIYEYYESMSVPVTYQTFSSSFPQELLVWVT